MKKSLQIYNFLIRAHYVLLYIMWLIVTIIFSITILPIIILCVFDKNWFLIPQKIIDILCQNKNKSIK